MTDDDDPRQEADGFLDQILADTSRDPYYRKTRVPAAACPAAGVEADETGGADEGGTPVSDGRPASGRWAFVREGRDVQDFYQQTARTARPRADQVADGRRARQALADLIAQDVTPAGGDTSEVKRRPEAPWLLQALMSALEPTAQRVKLAAGRLRGRWAARPKGPAGEKAGTPMRPAGARSPEDPPQPSYPAEPSEASSAAGDAPPSATRKARRRWGVILAAGLLLVNGLTAGLGLLHRRALADCQEGQETLISQRKDWRAARRRAQRLPVWRLTAAQVEEPWTVSAFHSTANQDTPDVMGCPTHAPASSLSQRAKTNRESTAWLKKQETILADRASLVERSRQAKLTTNAAGQVRRLVGEAKSLYASSQGKVADEATRSGLQDTIRAAGKPAATLSAYRRQERDLTAAMRKVSQSMKDKQEADGKAAQPQPAPAPAPQPAPAPVRPAPPAIRRPAPRPSRPTVPPAPAPAPSTPSGDVGVNVG